MAKVRVSRDGGRTYPARHTRPLPAEPPGQPCTVPVYDPATGTGRMLALDLDPSRGRGTTDPAVQVSAQADAIMRLVTRLGGRCVTDVAPGGGRHVYVLFNQPISALAGPNQKRLHPGIRRRVGVRGQTK